MKNGTIETIKLSNGITVVYEELPFVRSIAFGIWVKNGSRNESKTENGISHFIEHMLFKGTTTRSAKVLADEMDAIGGQLNAYTSKENTCFYTRVLDTSFDIALEILCDMFFNSNFLAEDIEKERNVIIEEIRMYEDTPEDLVHDMLQTKAFGGSSLGQPILGTEKSISKFEKDDFVKYFAGHYLPDNIVISVAGNFKAQKLLKKLEKSFGQLKSGKLPDTINASEYKPVIISKEKKIEQLHLCLSFPGIKLDSEDSYALSVFNTLFGGGMSSKLFQSIREDKGLVYSIYSYSQSYVDVGMYSIYAALNRDQLEFAFRSIISEVKDVFEKKLTDAQIERTKAQLKSNYVLSLESSSARMSSIGRSQLLLGRILSPDELIEKVEAVTADDVYNVAENVLDISKMSISAVGKLKNIDLEGLKSNAV